MKVFVTGGTGFIGSALVTALVKEGHEPTVLTRSPPVARRALPGGVRLVEGDPGLPGEWMTAVGGTDAAVNLAGEPVFGRWTEHKKAAIVRSRVDAARNLVAAIPSRPGYPLVSGSAVGIYGWRGDEELTEDAPPGTDWLASVAVRWEEEARRAELKGARVVLLRTGIVLGADGGALEQMVKPFRLGGGGPIGHGTQYLSWIHLDDEVGLIMTALSHSALAGPVNATAPGPVTNAEFARTLGEVLHRPAVVHAPAFALKLALGEFADTLLHGQRVVPARALAAGYHFRHPDLKEALASILGPAA